MGIENIGGLDRAISSEKENKKEQTNEVRVLREFVEEFNPFYQGQTENLTYDELVNIVKDIVEKM